MFDDTICTDTKVGQRLDSISKNERVSYLKFNNSHVKIASKITIGRLSDNDIVIDNKLASRHHAVIQQIKDDFYLKDLQSTNGTLLNGKPVPNDKYLKLSPGDVITIGKMNLVMS